MEGKGLVVQWKHMPVSHYRIKRRKWPKSTVNNDAIDFLQRIPEERRKAAMFRAFGRHKVRNWRLMRERDEKRQEARRMKGPISECLLSPRAVIHIIRKQGNRGSAIGQKQWDGLLLTLRHRNVPDWIVYSLKRKISVTGREGVRYEA